MRRSRVVFTLLAAGAIGGALCGFAAITPIAVQQWLRPSLDDAFVPLAQIAPWAAVLGGAIGTLLGPALALRLLRDAPLWRVFLQPTAGAAIGIWVGWGLGITGLLPVRPSLAAGAAAGIAISVSLLRRSCSKRRSRLPEERCS